MRPVFRVWLPGAALLAAALCAGCAAPTAARPTPLTPPLTSGAAAQALYAQWFVPQTMQALQAAQALHQTTQAYCRGATPLDVPRQAFTQAAQQWDRTAAVAMGPHIERRTARMIDFQPLRLPLLQAALRTAPRSLADMERIGAPAKGLPVTEHLLWRSVATPHSPACDYLQLVVADTVHELQQLHAATQAVAHSTALDFAHNEEFLNQWVGGVERLRWQAMDKPLRSATPGKPVPLTRAPSEGTVASWQAQWSGLRALAVGADHVSIVQLVQARGWQRLAGELLAAVAEVDTALASITSPSLEAVTPAVQKLAQLKHLVENDVALALDVTIGFSDADGD